MKYFDNAFWKMLAGFAVIILLGNFRGANFLLF